MAVDPDEEPVERNPEPRTKRLELQALLEGILGSQFVYFQAPSNVVMTYPCIRYARSNGDTQYADNDPYIIETRYMLTIIDEDPDSLIPAAIAKLRRCVYDRHYVVDGLNHDVFNLYF